MHERNLYWGEIHTHTSLSDGNGTPGENFEVARRQLDFWAMADHAFDEVTFARDYPKMKPDGQLLNDHWDEVQELCRAYEDPGRFVPFLAYEWTNFQYGHHNVYYLEYDQPIRMPPTLPELYESLRGVDAFVIPHHTAYPVGVCGKDWRFHDERLSPFVEIYSLHGSSEEPTGIQPILTYGSWMGPGASGGSVQEGLARGYKLGIMASSDSHGDHPGAYDNGLLGAYAGELTRHSLWEAFRLRRIYGVTGDRIVLGFSINGQPMGSVLQAEGKRAIVVSVVGWDKVERVDIVRNNRVLHSFVEPTGLVVAGRNAVRLRFMVEWGWDCRSAREWEGALTLTGGRILRAVPCFRGRVAKLVDGGITRLTDSSCTWKSSTEQVKYHMHFRHFADAIAFEVECAEDGRLRLSFTCARRRQEREFRPRDILARSVVVYMEGIPPTNDGAHWRHMETCAKFKVHQGRRTDELTFDLAYEDVPNEGTTTRTDCYYIRVIQRNGQRAWSSPIWVGS